MRLQSSLLIRRWLNVLRSSATDTAFCFSSQVLPSYVYFTPCVALMFSANDFTSLNSTSSFRLPIPANSFFSLRLVGQTSMGRGSLMISLVRVGVGLVAPLMTLETRFALDYSLISMTSPLQSQLNFYSFWFFFLSRNFYSCSCRFRYVALRYPSAFMLLYSYSFLSSFVNPSSSDTSVSYNFVYFCLCSLLSFSPILLLVVTLSSLTIFLLMLFFLQVFSGSMSAEMGRRESMVSGIGSSSCRLMWWVGGAVEKRKLLSSCMLSMVLMLEQGCRQSLKRRFSFICSQLPSINFYSTPDTHQKESLTVLNYVLHIASVMSVSACGWVVYAIQFYLSPCNPINYMRVAILLAILMAIAVQDEEVAVQSRCDEDCCRTLSDRLPMSFTYYQRTGRLVGGSGEFRIDTHGYSGQDKGYLNPDEQCTPFVGPIPASTYKLTACKNKMHQTRDTPCSFILDPQIPEEMCGRNDFLIHGCQCCTSGDDSQPPAPGCSAGCVIISYENRRKLRVGDILVVKHEENKAILE